MTGNLPRSSHAAYGTWFRQPLPRCSFGGYPPFGERGNPDRHRTPVKPPQAIALISPPPDDRQPAAILPCCLRHVVPPTFAALAPSADIPRLVNTEIQTADGLPPVARAAPVSPDGPDHPLQ